MPRNQAAAESQCSVVGIGASAGGVEALQGFFRALPNDLGHAYVVIFHLSPHHSSDLASILARCTSMPVAEVRGSVEFEANHVYVIPPNHDLKISETSIDATEFKGGYGTRTAIDVFFRSLAAKHGDTFAIILSGGGSDGALGARAIKEAGGLILVQDPAEAMHGDMPAAVIEAGVADVVANVNDLTRQLVRLTKNKKDLLPILHPPEEGIRLTREDQKHLRKIIDLLRSRTGHDFDQYKRSTILRRMGRRMQIAHAVTFGDYLRHLAENPDEVLLLLNDLLITVTTFFRDPDAWESLRKLVIEPLINAMGRDETIRVWVAGCATGEEAYSMAMLFHEEMIRRNSSRGLTIFASDIDEDSLATARAGRYPSNISSDVSESRLAQFFTRHGDSYQVNKDIRNCIVFAEHSVFRDPPFSGIHLVSCRNLLIYLETNLQEEVQSIFRYACRDDGYLFIGSAENALPTFFKPIDKHNHIYQMGPRLSEYVHLRRPVPGQLPQVAATIAERRSSRFQESVDLAKTHLEMLEKSAPPSMLVNLDRRVLHLSESAGRYLQPSGGEVGNGIDDLLRPELRDEAHSALHRAFDGGAPTFTSPITVALHGALRSVSMLVHPRPASKAGGQVALVIFLESDEVAAEAAVTDSDSGRETVNQLRQQLRYAGNRIATKDSEHDLTLQDLRAANEELQSLNEEYRSTAEELETSKEELQSVNEELHTVNAELSIKLEDTSRARSDLENLLEATQIPTLFLDRNFLIKRFTPPLREVFHIRTIDEGRPIADLTHNLEHCDIAEHARKVLMKVTPTEFEAKTGAGGTVMVRIFPYRAADDRIDGVVLTFIDITRAKESEEQLRQQAADLLKQDRAKEEFMNLLGHELRNPLAAMTNSLAFLKGGIQKGVPDPDESYETALGIFVRQTRHMTRLVNDLLEMSRINQGKLNLKPGLIDLGTCIKDTVENLDVELKAAMLAVSLDLPDTPVYARADPDRTLQVLDNILRNSVQFTEPGGTVLIKLDNLTEQARISIKDDGIGMEPDQIESLFEPYMQGARGRETGGLGLGLSLCRKLMTLQDGQITAHSDGPGHGSEFIALFPLAEDKPAPEHSESEPLPRLRVLVVDDEADNANSLALLLESLGQETRFANDGKTALEIARDFHPHLVFLDVAMPGMSGTQVARVMRGKEFAGRKMKLVGLSGHARVPGSKDFDQYNLKPATLDDICGILKSTPAD